MQITLVKIGTAKMSVSVMTGNNYYCSFTIYSLYIFGRYQSVQEELIPTHESKFVCLKLLQKKIIRMILLSVQNGRNQWKEKM